LTAAAKSTSQRMPASTGSPSGSVPSCGVSPTGRLAGIGAPAYAVTWSPRYRKTVQAPGSALAAGAFSYELARPGGLG
jgi:hypothetical protein